jgi:hypothetical protein
MSYTQLDSAKRKRLVFGIMCVVAGIFLSVIIFRTGYVFGKNDGFREAILCDWNE